MDAPNASTRVITLRGIIRAVPARFRAAHESDRGRKSWRGGCTIGDIIDQLDALDATTATPTDIADIIGNYSWTELVCDNCGHEVDAAVTLGEEPDYEIRTATVCGPCIRAAASAIEARSGETTKIGSTEGESASDAQPSSEQSHD